MDPERTVPNATNGRIREDALLVEISPVARLLDQCRRETMRVGLVMRQLVVHVVVDLINVTNKTESLCQGR